MTTSTFSPLALRTVRFRALVREIVSSFLALVLLILFACSLAHAQGGVPLITVATDRSVSGSLSNQFGVPAGQAIDQSGDLVFVGDGNSALFFRPAGANAASRLLQTGDQVPGFSGSHVDSFSPNVSINSSATIFFGVNYSAGDGQTHSALLTYDSASAAYVTISYSGTATPGVSAFPYGTPLAPLNNGINDNGDVAFTAATFGPSSTGVWFAPTSLFIVPAGSAPIQIAGTGSYSLIPEVTDLGFIVPVSGINALGQVLFTAGAVGSLSGTGLFVGSEAGGGQIFKVVLPGDSFCGGAGTVSSFSSTPTSAVLNNAGNYAFLESSVVNGITQTAICVGVPGGLPVEATGSGSAAPSVLGGTLGLQTVPSTLAMDDSGDIVFFSAIAGSGITTSALLRYHQLSGQMDTVAYAGEAALGQTSSSFTSSFSAFSIAANGSVAFAAWLSTGANSLYQQVGTAPPVMVAADAQAAPLSGGETFVSPGNVVGNPIVTELNNGSVFFNSLLQGPAAYYGEFMGTPGNLLPVMSTADALPANARVSLLAVSNEMAGTFVAFAAQQAGGRLSLFVSNTTSSVPTKAITEGDSAPGTGRAIATANQNLYVNMNGQIVFNSTVAITGPAESAIFTWSPSTGLAKVVAAGDVTPITGTTFSRSHLINASAG